MESERRAGLSAVLVLGGAALLCCWPWLLGGQAFPQRDAAFSMVAVQHLQRAVLGQVALDGAALGWPLGPGFVQADWMLGQALLGLPLALAGVGMEHAYGWLAFAGLVCTAWVGHRAARALVGPGPHTWLAGAVAGLGPLQLGHAPHVNLVHHELALGGALLLGLGLARDHAGRAAAGAALLAASFHFGIYLGLHASLVGGVVLAAAVFARRPCARTLLAAAAGGALVLATVLPVLAAYARFAALHRAGLGVGELAEEAWDPARTLMPAAGAWLHDLLPSCAARFQGQDPPNPGFVVAGLALLGLVPAWRRGWAWRAVIAAGALAALLALGPAPTWGGRPLGVPGPLALAYGLLDQPSLPAPARWLWVASAAAGFLASLGLSRLVGRLGPRTATAAGALAVLIAVGEAPRVATVPAATLRPPAVYRALAALPEGPLLERFSGHPAQGPHAPVVALRAALDHRRPLVGGHWARACPALNDVNRLVGRWPAAEAAEALRTLGVAAVLEHPPHRRGVPAGATCQEAGDFRLCALTPLPPGRLPDEDDLTAEGGGPVVALRFAASPADRRIEVRCPGQPPWRSSVAVWETLARVRRGPAAASFDVHLPQPCPGVPAWSGGGAEPLRERRAGGG